MIEIKPLSINAAFQGRRFKTPAYNQYEKDLAILLPKIMYTGLVKIDYTFYLKNFLMTDVDNLIKPLQDIIVKAGIIEDDRKIISLTAKKVKSGVNGIEFKISPAG